RPAGAAGGRRPRARAHFRSAIRKGAAMSPDPPVPPTLDMACFSTMPLDVRRLLTSDTWLRLAAKPSAAHAAVTLWSQCWHQVPAGSLPDDDAILWRLAMTDPTTW